MFDSIISNLPVFSVILILKIIPLILENSLVGKGHCGESLTVSLFLWNGSKNAWQKRYRFEIYFDGKKYGKGMDEIG